MKLMKGYPQAILLLQCGSSLRAAGVTKLCVPVGLDPQLFPAFKDPSQAVSPKALTSARADYTCDTTHSFSSPERKNEVALKYTG